MSLPAPWTTFKLTQGAVVVEIQIESADDLNVSGTPEGGYITRRATNGRALRQFRWQKMTLAFSARGDRAPDFGTFDFAEQATLECAEVAGSPMLVFVDPFETQTDIHGAVVGWTQQMMEA